MDNHQAAAILQVMICDAICDNDPKARAWLHLPVLPDTRGVFDPSPESFIGICKQLGISWAKLRWSLLDAISLEPQVYIKPTLRLVHSHEPDYSLPRETNLNSGGISKTQKSKHKLHLQAM